MFIPSNKNQSTLSAAFHETGHVLIHEVFGWSYTDAYVNEAGKEGVRYTYSDPREESPVLDKLIYACICLAGSIAEDKFDRPNIKRKELGVSLIDGGLDQESDISKYYSLKFPPELFEEIIDATIDIILDNWEAVSKIATTLEKEGHLTNEDVKKLLNEADLTENKSIYMDRLEQIQKIIDTGSL